MCQRLLPGSRPSSRASLTEPHRTANPAAPPPTAQIAARAYGLTKGGSPQTHGKASASTGFSWLESFPHRLERGGATGPELERDRALRQQHAPAVRSAKSERPRLAHEWRPALDVHEVDHRALFRQRCGAQRHLLTPAEGCRVDDHVGRTCQRRDRRVVPSDGLAGYVDLVGTSRDKREVRAFQRLRGRTRGAAGAEDDRVRAARLHSGVLDGETDRRDVGVESSQPAAVADDRVHGTRAKGLVGDGVEEFHHGLLVGDGDVGPGDIRRLQLLERSGKLLRLDVEQLVAPAHSERAKRCVVHDGAARISDSLPEEKDLQLPLTPYFLMSLSKSAWLVSKCVVPCLSVK